MEDKFIKDGKKVTDKTEEQKSVELVVSILKTKKEPEDTIRIFWFFNFFAY